jgi:elongation factor G
MNNNLDERFYRETVQDSGIGEGKVIRHGNNIDVYAHARVAVRPLAQGQGVQIAWEAGGGIPPRFASAVIEGVQDAMDAGTLAGMKMIDVRACIEDGSYHDLDSTADAFREAARQGTTEALQQAQPVLLEAVAQITTTASTEFLPIIDELVISFGGRVSKTQSGDQISVVEARVPAPRASDLVGRILAATDGRSPVSLVIAGFEMKREPPDTFEQWVPVK